MIDLHPKLEELSGLTGARVMIVRAGALGDTILLLPTLGLLARRLPGARLTLVGSRWARRLQALSAIDWSFFPFESPQLTALFGESPGDIPLPLRPADAAILYTSSPQGPFARNLGRSVPRILTAPVHPVGQQHAAVHFASALAASPVPPDALPAPRLRAGEEARDAAGRWLADVGVSGNRPLIVLHPGSGSPLKCWPAGQFGALAKGLLEDRMDVIVLEGPADRRACRALTEHVPDLPLFRGRDLSEVAGLLTAARACVTNDSGVGHLAGALGVATVSVFGPTDPATWQPLGRRVIALRGAKQMGGTGLWPPEDRVRRALDRIIG